MNVFEHSESRSLNTLSPICGLVYDHSSDNRFRTDFWYVYFSVWHATLAYSRALAHMAGGIG